MKSIRMHHRLMGSCLSHGIYGLNFSHKHVEEMRIFRLNKSTAFLPAVGHFERGMLTQCLYLYGLYQALPG